MKHVLLSVLVGVLLAIGAQKATTHYFPAPTAAAVLVICGEFGGALVTYSDGSVEKFGQESNLDVLSMLVDSLPQESRGLLSAITPACKPATEKVY